MTRILKSPSKYIQGSGILREIDSHLGVIGTRFLILISTSGIKRVKPILIESFKEKGYEIRYEIFSGECTKQEVNRLVKIVDELCADAIIGIGGGKILDTAKAVAYYSKLPMVIIPTVASTDSPCSSLSVLYKENGEFDTYLFLKTCPDMVFVDTEIISKAPVKLLVAGMGDAMATYFEARACKASGKNNQVNGKPTSAATALAKLCWENLKSDGLKAKIAVEAGVCTESLEKIVETNTFLSSVGFESGGLGAAHAIQKGLTHIPELHHVYHGEKVAFCTIVQLVLENSPMEEIMEVIEFCHTVGLPIKFSDMGYNQIRDEDIRKVVEISCLPTSTIHNMPFEITQDMVYASLLVADRLGQQYDMGEI